jgi:hypothetical protein
MVECLVTDEMERMWKEAVVANLRHYPDLCLEGLRKTKKHLDQNIRSPSKNSNRNLTKNKSEALGPEPSTSMRTRVVCYICTNVSKQSIVSTVRGDIPYYGIESLKENPTNLQPMSIMSTLSRPLTFILLQPSIIIVL